MCVPCAAELQALGNVMLVFKTDESTQLSVRVPLSIDEFLRVVSAKAPDSEAPYQLQYNWAQSFDNKLQVCVCLCVCMCVCMCVSAVCMCVSSGRWSHRQPMPSAMCVCVGVGVCVYVCACVCMCVCVCVCVCHIHRSCAVLC